MFETFLLPGTDTFKDTMAIYFEGVKEFFEEILYYITKFEFNV